MVSDLRTTCFLVPQPILQMLDRLQAMNPNFSRSEVVRAILDYWVPIMFKEEKEHPIALEEMVPAITTFNLGPIPKNAFANYALHGFTNKSHMFHAMMYAQLWTNAPLDFSKVIAENKKKHPHAKAKLGIPVKRLNENAVEIDGQIYVKAKPLEVIEDE